MAQLLAGFGPTEVDVDGIRITGRMAGSGSPVLLLHGYPQTHVMWHRVAVMARLGFDSFAAVGHDRGARVVHRMCLDHPTRVSRAAVLDIVPTRHTFATVSPPAIESPAHCWSCGARRQP